MFAKLSSSVRKAHGRGRVLMQAALVLLAISITAIPTAAQSVQSAKDQVASTYTTTSTSTANPVDVTCPADGQCFADVSSSSSFYDFVNRIFEQGLVSGFACGGAGEPCDSENRPYYRPGAQVTRQQMAKFIDNARHLSGIEISADTTDTVPINVANASGIGIRGGTLGGPTQAGVQGVSTNGIGVQGISGGPIAVLGIATNGGVGVEGTTSNGFAVLGHSDSSTGVRGTSESDNGVVGITAGGVGKAGVSGSAVLGEGVVGVSTSDVGVYAQSTTGSGLYAASTSGFAGFFQGDINVTGNCTGCTGPTKMDDPLDPANKYLYQSSVHSDDTMSIYNGNVTTDSNGDAVVSLPDYFEALNKDYRYQLTVIDQFAQAIVSHKISGNRFSIKTDKPNVEVSWQVTGIWQDPYTNATRVTGEQDKPASAQGTYVHPVQLGQPASTGENYEQSQLFSK